MKITELFKQRKVASRAQRAFFGLLAAANVPILIGSLWHTYTTDTAIDNTGILLFAVIYSSCIFQLGYLAITGWLPGHRREN